MDRATLVDGLTTDVFAYVMNGSVSERVVTEAVKPDGLDERYAEFAALADLHFVLRDDVVEFVEALPEHLRELETQTRTRTRQTNGRVEGRVNWQQTVRARATAGGGDAVFVCDTRTEQYDTPENLVLKRLLAVVYRAIESASVFVERDYDWMNAAWTAERVDSLRRVVERNVHVARIREPAAYEPTDRMLEAASDSRKQVYRESARLLREREAVQSGDPDALRRLLAETAITPDDEETLVELYTLFRTIRAIDDLRDGSFTLEPIRTGRQEVARFTGDVDVTIYHDNSGSDDIAFKALRREAPAPGRADRVQEEALSVANTYFREQTFTNHTGRPDVLVLEVEDDDRRDYFVVEVKNSTRTDTVRAGIKEALEYLAFLQENDEYVFGDDDLFGDGWNALLVTQDFHETETAPLDHQETMRILQAGELAEKLPRVLEHVLPGEADRDPSLDDFF